MWFICVVRCLADNHLYCSQFAKIFCDFDWLCLHNTLSADISVAVVNLLQEMTDVDTLTESEESAEVLTDALVTRECL